MPRKPKLPKRTALDRIVREGGVYWTCTECGNNGAIKASSPIAQFVRQKLGAGPVGPARVQFDQCAQHTPNDTNERRSDQTHQHHLDSGEA